MFKISHDQIKARFPYDLYRRMWSLRLLRKKENFSDRSDHSDHMKPLSSDRSNRSDNNLSDRCRCDRWRVVSIWSLNFFFSAMVAIAAITWKPGLIYRNNHSPFLLNCYLYAWQTYRTHSSKLRLLLVVRLISQTRKWADERFPE